MNEVDMISYSFRRSEIRIIKMAMERVLAKGYHELFSGPSERHEVERVLEYVKSKEDK